MVSFLCAKTVNGLWWKAKICLFSGQYFKNAICIKYFQIPVALQHSAIWSCHCDVTIIAMLGNKICYLTLALITKRRVTSLCMVLCYLLSAIGQLLYILAVSWRQKMTWSSAHCSPISNHSHVCYCFLCGNIQIVDRYCAPFFFSFFLWGMKERKKLLFSYS